VFLPLLTPCLSRPLPNTPSIIDKNALLDTLEPHAFTQLVVTGDMYVYVPMARHGGSLHMSTDRGLMCVLLLSAQEACRYFGAPQCRELHVRRSPM
jgi:hypothetical protein